MKGRGGLGAASADTVPGAGAAGRALQPSQTTRGRPHERSRPTDSSPSYCDRELLTSFEFRTFLL